MSNFTHVTRFFFIRKAIQSSSEVKLNAIIFVLNNEINFSDSYFYLKEMSLLMVASSLHHSFVFSLETDKH